MQQQFGQESSGSQTGQASLGQGSFDQSDGLESLGEAGMNESGSMGQRNWGPSSGTRLRQDLRTVVDDIEQVVRELSESAGTHVGEAKERATVKLADVRRQLNKFEDKAGVRLQQANQQAQGYIRLNPWKAVGGVSVAAFLLGLMSRRKH